MKKNKEARTQYHANRLPGIKEVFVPRGGRSARLKEGVDQRSQEGNLALSKRARGLFWITLNSFSNKEKPLVLAAATQAAKQGKTDTNYIKSLLENQDYHIDPAAEKRFLLKVAALVFLMLLMANCSSADANTIPDTGNSSLGNIGFTKGDPEATGEEEVLAVPGEVETGTEEVSDTPELEGQPVATPVIVRRGDVIDRMVLELEKSGINDTTVNIPEVGGTGGTYKITQEQVKELKEIVTAELNKLAGETIIAKEAIPDIEGLASEERDNPTETETEGVQIVVSWTIDEDGKFHIMYTIAGDDENYSKNTGIMMVKDQEGQKVPLFVSPEEAEQRILEETGVEVRVPIVVLDGNIPVALNESSEVVARVNPDTKQWEIMGQEGEGLEVKVKPTQETSGSAVEPTAEPTAEPTTEPTPEASPTPSVPTATTKSSDNNLRSGPGIDYDPAGQTQVGTKYEIIGTKERDGFQWLELKDESGNIVWGWQKLFDQSGANEVAVSENIPPTPIPAPTKEVPTAVEQSTQFEVLDQSHLGEISKGQVEIPSSGETINVTTINYGSVILHVDQAFVDRRIGFARGEKEKLPGELPLPISEDLWPAISEYGAKIHAHNLGIDITKSNWKSQFKSFLKNNPGFRYQLMGNVLIEGKPGTFSSQVIAEVDPSKPIEMTALNPEIERGEDNAYQYIRTPDVTPHHLPYSTFGGGGYSDIYDDNGEVKVVVSNLLYQGEIPGSENSAALLISGAKWILKERSRTTMAGGSLLIILSREELDALYSGLRDDNGFLTEWKTP